jgi:hypothetical protein
VFIAITPLAGWQADGNSPLTNKDIISLVRNRLPEAAILKHIARNKTNFDVSTSGLIRLKNAGVSAKVIEAMQAASDSTAAVKADAHHASNLPTPAIAATTSPSAADASAAQPAVSLLQGPSKTPVAAEATKLAQTKSKATSLVELAKDKAVVEALNAGVNVAQNLAKGQLSQQWAGAGGNVARSLLQAKQLATQAPKQMYVWALQGPTSATNATGTALRFEVSYAGISGVNASSFEPVILKLEVAQATDRLVGATQVLANAEQNTQPALPAYSSFIEERVPTSVEQLGPGRTQIVPSSVLPAGQYAVALRPKDKSHKFAAQDVANNQGEGLLFNYVWSFSVN